MYYNPYDMHQRWHHQKQGWDQQHQGWDQHQGWNQQHQGWDHNWNNNGYWDNNNYHDYWDYNNNNWNHNGWDHNNPAWFHQHPGHHHSQDYGPNPYVVNIERATMMNDYYRTALWTGEYLQLTLMSIEPGDDIGLEIHNDHDQFIRVEGGHGLVQMGDRRDRLDFQRQVADDDAIFIPAGKWHNLTNTGRRPLKLYSIYAPPEHPRGTVHRTKADAMEHGHY
ncbi:mannose-6-phosphate isomerase-like protein (cupin superfamily) [Alkalibacillus filiformis]|uniref:Mannose-6-phosphate isomerase-like protein (Cupin superfamily) n=1 Tax=Alkalibacillus filiformis TaxID=200990 RepID=A0ABU0DU91_9BACI|nr:cupin domain-containing protein [Alkalibacillus filiformis]MDQ0351715.1 mannose-6-phosphate isomerase-like protein (cupin superfamily) [Alkalibacillus filiformis]